VNIVPSAARTTSGTSAEFDVPDGASDLLLLLNVTAVGGVTPTLDVVLEDSLDGTNWDGVAGGAFTQRTAVGRQRLVVSAAMAQRARMRSTIGGTAPTFTFAVDGEFATA
jgi:hypothetical protein